MQSLKMRQRHMRMRRWAGSMAAVLVVAGGTTAAHTAWPSASEAVPDRPSEVLAREAVADDDAMRGRAIAELRRRGPAGHAALMTAQADGVRALRMGQDSFPGAERLRAAIDRVSGQRDGHASGLYWHTDLEAAKRDAERTGRPILSLRLLGALDEELSCANSRFFRVVLYSDPRVAARLREQYVLHWSSERPAPRITIEMGDGRAIVRTITGNSIHYVLDTRGRPLDGIVGLYAPAAFLAALDEAERAFETCGASQAGEQTHCLGLHHQAANAALRMRWEEMVARDGAMVSFDSAVGALRDLGPIYEEALPVPAYQAMALTVRKSLVEAPMLDAMGIGAPPSVERREPDFARAGVLLYGAAEMSAEGRALVRLKVGARDADRAQAELTRTALADAARNELLFRRVIHERFTEGAAETTNFATMNEWVYRALMRTPASDPWLGLASGAPWDAVERG